MCTSVKINASFKNPDSSCLLGMVRAVVQLVFTLLYPLPPWAEDISGPPAGLGLGHVTCFGQRTASGQDGNGGL